MELKIITIPVGPLGVNCYIVYNNSNDKALIIDPGGDFSLIEEQLKIINKCAGAVFVTHCHFDHVMAVKQFNMMGVPVFMNEKELDFINSNANLAKYFGIKFIPFSVDNRLIEGFLDVCGYKIQVFETPGHTIGSVCLQIEDALFTGDTLFKESYGRTDFPTGSMKQLVLSIKKLFAMDENLRVYPGHNEPTTIKAEKIYNPINLLL